VGTPGRLIDLQESGAMDLSKVGYLVVDEADRMFDMGFYPELRKLIKVLPSQKDRQTMLFSATLNTYVKNLAWEYTENAKEIEIEPENITVEEIAQELIHVSSDDKMKLLLGILKRENPESVIIFCNTKRSCEVIAKRLQINQINADFIIGDLPQATRLKVLNLFKEGKLSCLVATDVAARGIDVSDLAMVINYDLPNESENYVHRIGRTARAGKSGKAYTFCSEQDVYNLPAIERYIEMSIPSRVAYPEQMLEDKSSGIYIKTEFGHDDHDDRKKSNRSYDKNRSDNRGHREGHSKGDYKGNSHKNYKGKNDRNNNHKKYDKNKSVDFAKMENMSFEDRMKIYKEKYGNSSENRGKNYNSKNPNGYKKNYHKNNDYKGKNKNHSSKTTNYKNQNAKVQQKPVAKKGLFARIKAFFSK
jgi:ATP-dependent RNA helicase RhlB